MLGLANLNYSCDFMEPSATSPYAFPGAQPATEDRQALLRVARFAALCLATGGLYSLWWQYKTWRFFKQCQQSGIWPVARARRQSPEYPTREQAGFSLRQVLGLALGVLIWVLALYSLPLPD